MIFLLGNTYIREFQIIIIKRAIEDISHIEKNFETMTFLFLKLKIINTSTKFLNSTFLFCINYFMRTRNRILKHRNKFSRDKCSRNVLGSSSRSMQTFCNLKHTIQGSLHTCPLPNGPGHYMSRVAIQTVANITTKFKIEIQPRKFRIRNQ